MPLQLSQTELELVMNVIPKILPVAARIELRQTCWACPEQYDAYLDGVQVGYLRLRHGSFSVWSADQQVEYMRAHPRGDGSFEDDEREHYLTQAKLAIALNQ